VRSSTDSTGPDYRAVEITSETRSEYSYVERRAELLQLVREAGHPRALNQTQLAERYDVSQQQISKDLDRLAEYVRESAVERDRRAFTVNSVVERSIRGLLREEEYRKAAKTAIEWDEWLTEFRDLDELAERIEELEARPAAGSLGGGQ
jgi:DNA-binding MarR family transcriptional regulator